MPTYEYECNGCGNRFDIFQSITAAPLKKCPKCKASKLKRLIGAGAALLFKGSGFYTTDYRSESYKKSAESESKPAGEAKSEAKADATTKACEASGKPAGDTKPAATKPAATEPKPPPAKSAQKKTKSKD